MCAYHGRVVHHQFPEIKSLYDRLYHPRYHHRTPKHTGFAKPIRDCPIHKRQAGHSIQSPDKILLWCQQCHHRLYLPEL